MPRFAPTASNIESRAVSDILTETVSRAMRESTQWNPAYETAQVTRISQAIRLLLDLDGEHAEGRGVESPEQYNALTEGMRASLRLLSNNLMLDGERYTRSAYTMAE